MKPEIDRRTLLAATTSLPITRWLWGDTSREDVVVDTGSGRLRGRRTGRVASFKGVRYGEETSTRRFRAAQPARRWAGIRDALDYANHAPQLSIGLGEASILAGLSIERPQSEDCLFLNLWASSPTTRAQLPVMVWLHGGGFVAGSGASHLYDGTRLADRENVVVVTLNHRLGIFGHWSLGDAAHGKATAALGNAGMLDIVLALRWVRDHIAAFGGDPGNVTVFGESGGGAKVSTLMAMPAAKGLFHKAIVQSGSLIRAHDAESAGELQRAVLNVYGLGPDDATLMVAMPFAAIQSRAGDVAKSVGWRMGPVVDGHHLPRHPCDPDGPAISRHVPLLVGSTRDESTLIAGAFDPGLFTLEESALPARLTRLVGAAAAPELIAGMRAIHPSARPGDLYFRIASWLSVRRNATIQAERKAAQGCAPAYAYLLAWETPVEGGRWKSPHALDLPLVFDTVDRASQLVGEGAEPQRVADAMRAAWGRFARTGTPGWPSFDPERRATMVFDVESRTENDPDGAERRLLAGPPVNTLAPGR